MALSDQEAAAKPSDVRVSCIALVNSAVPQLEAWLAALDQELRSAVGEYELIIAPVSSSAEHCSIPRDGTVAAHELRWLPPSSSGAAAFRAALAVARLPLVAIFASRTHSVADLVEHAPAAMRGRLITIEPSPEPRWIDQTADTVEHAAQLLLAGGARTVRPQSLLIAPRQALQGCPLDHDSAEVVSQLAIALVDQGIPRIGVQPAQPLPSGTRGRLLNTSLWSRLADVVRSDWRRRFSPSETAASSSGSVHWGNMLLLLLVAGMLLIPRLKAPLLDPDEGRHAEIAREMWESGDWIAPTFLGEPYLDKPPLLYWLCNACFAAFGVSHWAARLVPAGAAVCTLLAVYVLGGRLVGHRAAGAGAMILCLSLAFAVCSQFLFLESLLTLFVVVALLTGYLAGERGGWQWRWWGCSAVAAGLGLLTKGPIALVLVVPPLFVQQWIGSTAAPSQLRRWSVFGLIAAAMAAPWYIAVTIRRPEFFRYFFWDHNFGRFLSGSDHPEPFFFYAPVLIVGTLPWSLLLASTARFLLSRRCPTGLKRDQSLGFLLLWSAWCLGFFSLSSGKLPYYILSCIPPLALAMGYYLEHVARVFSEVLIDRQAALIRFQRGAVAVACGGAVIGVVLWVGGLLSLAAAVAATGVWALAARVAQTLPHWNSARAGWTYICALAFLSIAEITHCGVAGWQHYRSVLPQEPSLLAQLRDHRNQVVCVGADWGSVPFMLQRNDVEFVPASELRRCGTVIDPDRPAIFLIERKVPFAAVKPHLECSATVTRIHQSHRLQTWKLDPPRVAMGLIPVGLRR